MDTRLFYRPAGPAGPDLSLRLRSFDNCSKSRSSRLE
jgi:hypothetical protein